jgi:hypothetical protein
MGEVAGELKVDPAVVQRKAGAVEEIAFHRPIDSRWNQREKRKPAGWRS